MSRRVVRSVSAAVRLAHARSWLREHGSGGAVLVAPSRGAADDFGRALAAEGSGFFGLHRYTPRRLALELATRHLAAEVLAPMTPLGARALAARATAAVATELSYLRPVANYPGFAAALARTLGELSGAGVPTDALVEAGAAGGDLARLRQQHDAEVSRFDLADTAAVLRSARVGIESGHELVGLPLLLLDVVPETAAEAELWRALGDRAPAVLGTLPTSDPDGPRLAEALAGEAEDLDADAPAATRLDTMRRRIFDLGAAEQSLPEDDTLQIVAAPGEGREAVEIARRVHELALAGTPFDRIAILLRDPDSYLGLVEDALRRADVPAWFTRGTVRPDPAGRAFLALLGCATSQLAASRFAEYLSLGQVPAPDETGAPPPREVPWVEPDSEQLVFKTVMSDALPGQAAPEVAAAPPDPEATVVEGTLRAPRHWERLLVDAAVVGGRDRWARRLGGLREELRQRLRGLEDADTGGREHLERQIADLGHLERYALPLIDELGDLPDRATWGEWIRRLRHLAGRTLRDPERVLGVLAELEPMEKVDEVDLQEVVRVLEERLTFLRREPVGHRYGRVFVGTIDEARGRCFDIVFLPGLAEGKFPRRAAEDPLLLDATRTELGARLDTRDERIERERLLLRVAAGAAQRRLVVSYPTLDVVQGRARVPSFYALDILRAAEGRLPDSQTLDERARSLSVALIGWPAPRDPQQAIDDAEFDIAYLEPMLRSTTHEFDGRARFLLDRNEHLARSLRTRHMRWRRTFSAADGLVRPTFEAERALSTQRLGERSYSPTALQNFASCPYKFVLYAMHRLRPREEIAPLEQMDPLTRGSLFHDVMYELYTRLRADNALPITEATVGEASAAVDAVLDEVAGTYEERLAPAIGRVWRDEIDSMRTDLRGWIRRVAETDGNWTPTYFEFSFGLGRQAGRDDLSHHDEAIAFDRYRLRGSIDLLEHDPDRDAWRVTDYKTGKAYWKQFLAVGGGEVLQPLLYALAAEHHLGVTVESGRLFYSTRRGGFEERVVEVNKDNRRRIEQVLNVVDQAIADGFLPAAPRERACDFCDYRRVCGPYEQTRIANKDQGGLERLRWLREQP